MAKRNMPKKEEPEVVYKNVPIEENEPIRLMVANCGLLNLREKPTKESKSLFKLRNGTIVLIDEILGDWLHVRAFGNELEISPNSQPGYILGQYTSEV